MSSERALGDGTGAQIASTEKIDLYNQVVYFEGERSQRPAPRRSSVASQHGMAARAGVHLSLRGPAGLDYGPRERHERLRAAARQAAVSEAEVAHEAIDDYLAKGA